MVPLLILVALLIPPLLAYLGFISLVIMFVADIAILLVAAWGLDRGRAVGARDPFLDANRPDYSSPFTVMIPPLPTEAFEDPEDRPGAL
jgi:hypothetical protein